MTILRDMLERGATFTIETESHATATLALPAEATSTTLWLNRGDGTPHQGEWYLIGNETVLITRYVPDTGGAAVIRGFARSDVTAHNAGTPIYRQRLVAVQR